ncbi:MAG: hypothetical protein WAW88_14585 [Nocardioides sp.]
MIESAEDFHAWWAAADSIERVRAMRAPVATEVLADVVRSFPECSADVARRRETPLDLLARLRADEDERVRWCVRTNERWLSEHPEDACPWDDDPSVPIQFRLDDDERRVLRAGLIEWGGPATCTTELAVAMGYQSLADLFEEGGRIGDAIAEGRPLSRTDWTRALLATEIAFASNVMGSGLEWPITTGFEDEATLKILRSLQRKIVTGGVVGVTLGTRPPMP